jgi:hypothetical protein
MTHKILVFILLICLICFLSSGLYLYVQSVLSSLPGTESHFEYQNYHPLRFRALLVVFFTSAVVGLGVMSALVRSTAALNRRGNNGSNVN